MLHAWRSRQSAKQRDNQNHIVDTQITQPCPLFAIELDKNKIPDVSLVLAKDRFAVLATIVRWALNCSRPSQIAPASLDMRVRLPMSAARLPVIYLPYQIVLFSHIAISAISTISHLDRLKLK